MSVSYWTKNELANVAKAMNRRPFGSDEILERACRDLATISRANAWAWNETYKDKVEPVTFTEIFETAKGSHQRTGYNTTDVIETVNLLHYNCVSNDGDIKETAELYKALVNVLNNIMTLAIEQARDVNRGVRS